MFFSLGRDKERDERLEQWRTMSILRRSALGLDIAISTHFYSNLVRFDAFSVFSNVDAND